MDFEQEQLDDERLSVNILQLASTPPDDIVRTTIRPAILRSRRAAMPALSTSPSSTPLDNPVLSLSSNLSSVNTPSSTDNSPSSQSLCSLSPPSPPPKLSICKERKVSMLTSTIKDSDHASSFSQSDNSSTSSFSPQLDIADFECPLCFQVYLQPVTTPCGHVFCKQCLFRAFKHSPACPLCRHKTDSSVNQKYSVNIVLMNVIEKYFPKEYRERTSEEEDTQKNEPPLKPENEENNNRPNSPSWGCILPSLRSTCTVLLSCGGF